METINTELKKAIFNYMIDNKNEFNLLNNTVDHFKEYIYNSEGSFLIGGDDVYKFIIAIDGII